MNLDLKHIIFFISFIPVAISVTCIECGSLTSSCDKSLALTCTGGSCAKFNADVNGFTFSYKYCTTSTPTGCRTDTAGVYTGTRCYCNSNYCNHSSNGPRSFMAIYISVAWVIIKFLT